ncbi:hypothetical protein KGP16_09460 [Serratia sp. JSRIV006]|nr:hypothetical protein KGP16_09460 [Serratia sp. JSRIV006]
MINLSPGLFGIEPNEVYRGAGFTVTAFMFPGDIAALVLQNQRGTLTLLPYQDLMIWDAVFDGQSLKAKASQLQPRRNDARGCFASHQGLPANHGPVIDVWLEVEEEAIAVRARTADGPCRIQPAVQLAANSTQFSIEMVIDNLAEQAQPLSYMCHMNYACEEGAVFRQNLPGCALNIRNNPQQVICSDDLSLYVDQAEFFMLAPCGRRYVTRFATGQFSYAVLRRPRANSRVTAFVQPASCSPESTATPMAVMLKAGEMREFRVTTGIL